MKILCLANTGLSLPETYLKPEFCYTTKLEFPLQLEKNIRLCLKRMAGEYLVLYL